MNFVNIFTANSVKIFNSLGLCSSNSMLLSPGKKLSRYISPSSLIVRARFDRNMVVILDFHCEHFNRHTAVRDHGNRAVFEDFRFVRVNKS